MVSNSGAIAQTKKRNFLKIAIPSAMSKFVKTKTETKAPFTGSIYFAKGLITRTFKKSLVSLLLRIL